MASILYGLDENGEVISELVEIENFESAMLGGWKADPSELTKAEEKHENQLEITEESEEVDLDKCDLEQLKSIAKQLNIKGYHLIKGEEKLKQKILKASEEAE